VIFEDFFQYLEIIKLATSRPGFFFFFFPQFCDEAEVTIIQKKISFGNLANLGHFFPWKNWE
jgi:hypothetical protein